MFLLGFLETVGFADRAFDTEVDYVLWMFGYFDGAWRPEKNTTA